MVDVTSMPVVFFGRDQGRFCLCLLLEFWGKLII